MGKKMQKNKTFEQLLKKWNSNEGYGCQRDPVCGETKRISECLLIFLQIRQLKSDKNNSRISKACISLSQIVFPVAKDFASNSPQEAGASHSDFVVPT